MNSTKIGPAQLVSPSSDHCFFGYYDKSPWNGSEDSLLFHRVGFLDRYPKPDDEAEIMMTKSEIDSKPTIVGRTTAWNFQLGSSLQWVGPEYKRFAYNDRENGDLVARIHDPRESTIRTINSPIYTVAPSGTVAATLNFKRLQRTRPGYGYLPAEDVASLEDTPADDGLYRLSLDSGEKELIVSIDRLSNVSPVPSMDDGLHWINHLTFSPIGEHIAFLHRWETGDGGTYTRLFTVKPNGEDLQLVVDSGKITHYTWYSAERLLAWSRRESSISDASKQGLFDIPLVSSLVNFVRQVTIPSWIRQNVIGDQYYLHDLTGDEPEPIGTGLLDRDGHPSVAHEGRWMVTDTYPDTENKRNLILCDFKKKQRFDIGSYKSRRALDSTPFRCDLHPRWNRSETKICFDSIHDGHRGIYVLDVKPLVERSE